MAIRMQQRRGTSTQWTTADPTLAAGEIGFETNTGKFKIGDGSTAWTSLSYFRDTTAIETTVDSKVSTAISNLIGGAPGALDTLNELAAALDNDGSFASTVTTALAGKAGLTAFTNHTGATTNVHGITNTANLAYVSDLTTVSSNASTDATNKADAAQAAAIAAAAADATSKANAAEAAASTALSAHGADTTDVHGIANTADLATQSYASGLVNTHSSGTTNIHGIADTANLATKTFVGTEISTHNSDTTDVHGITDTSALATKTGAETLTNKTISLGSNTVSGTKAQFNAAMSDADFATLDGTETLTNKTLTSPSITSPTGIVKADVGLGNVDNTSDANKPVSTATQTALDLKAPLASPTFTGTVTTPLSTAGYVKTSALGVLSSSAAIAQADVTNLTSDLALKAPLASPTFTGVPAAPTASAGTNTTQVATTAFVSTAVANLVASAPATLDTLNELATALGNDASFSTTVTNSLAAKAPLASPTFTGTVTVSASGIAFTDGTQSKEGVPSRTPIIQKTAAYTLSALSERDSMIEVSHTGGTAVDITIPANSSVAYPVGTSIDVLRTNTGGVRIVGAAGVTVNATPGAFLRAQWSAATLFKRATDTWVLIGDLATA